MSEGTEWGRNWKLYWYCCCCVSVRVEGPAFLRRPDNRLQPYFDALLSADCTFFFIWIFPISHPSNVFFVLTLSNISPHPSIFPSSFHPVHCFLVPSCFIPLLSYSTTLLILFPHSLFFLVFSAVGTSFYVNAPPQSEIHYPNRLTWPSHTAINNILAWGRVVNKEEEIGVRDANVFVRDTSLRAPVMIGSR